MSAYLQGRQGCEDVELHDAGPCSLLCPHCKAGHWKAENVGTGRKPRFSKCCADGKVELPNVFDAPTSIRGLFTALTELSSRFLRAIRYYNNAFAFVSTGMRRDMSVAGQGGVYTFKVQGQLHHRIGTLLPADGAVPAFAQVYFVETDPATASGVRMQQSGAMLDPTVVSIIEGVIRQVNPYARLLQNARPLLDPLNSTAQDVAIKLLEPGRDTGADPRTYNRPSVPEVAALIVTPSGSDFDVRPRDILIRFNSGATRRIPDIHPSFHPLRFPLLIPYGHFGWQEYIPLAGAPRAIFAADEVIAEAALRNSHFRRGRGNGGSTRVTLEQFHSFHLHARDHFSTLFHAGTLLQEWIVDAWVVIEANRLRFLRLNQATLRAEVYNGLRDALLTGSDLNNIGVRVVLPASHTNSPRFWQARYHDAMALVREYGKPDIFLTMTCNPHWAEIQQNLHDGQTASDRPDIVTRVFNLKLRYLLDLLLRRHVLGRVVAYVHSVEFQKRGLPHAHVLLIFAPADKPRTVDVVDSLISAEIPDPDTDPDLYRVVTTNMIHGPCNSHSPCMQNPQQPGVCKRGFPKDFREHTSVDTDGYPVYRRRAAGNVAHVRSGARIVDADNRWVVPYNPFLSKHLGCHINVEVCTSMSAVKYLYKYVFKGPDHISMQADGVQDEIDAYVDARYVSPNEGMYRILSLPLHGISPSVHALQIHLPNEQRVTFDPDDPQRSLESLQASTSGSKLLAFFRLCQLQPVETANVTYATVPRYFCWNARRKEWKQRRIVAGQPVDPQVGRIYFVPHSQPEKYFLRRLLHEVQGPKSFEDLRTFDGVVYPTFRQACAARGLLRDDAEWSRCLHEASLTQRGASLRHLFCIIVIHNTVEDVPALYHAFRHQLADDCAHALRHRAGIQTEARILSYSRHLLAVEISRIDRSKSLATYGIPEPDHEFSSDVSPLRSALAAELRWNPGTQYAIAESRRAMLSDEQTAIYNHVTEAVSQRAAATFFLQGAGGCGKTFLINTILAHVRGQGQIALAVASSGIAAIILEGGRTAHFRFKLPLDLDRTSNCSISKQSAEAEVFRRAAFIVWDEAPMQVRYAFEAVDRMLADIRDDERPFGGCTVLFSGDWRQTLPVLRHASPEQIVAVCLHKSHLWKNVVRMELHTNLRLLQVRSDVSRQAQAWYARWVLAIGQGELGPEVHIPDPLRLNGDSADPLISFIYGDLNSSRLPRLDYFRDRVILHARNVDVGATNNTILQQLTSASLTYYASDRALTPDGDEDPAFGPEYLATLNPAGMSEYALTLRVNAPVMLIRNLDPDSGLCNGTRLIITELNRRFARAVIMTGAPEAIGQPVTIPRVTLKTASGQYPFTLERQQLPLRVCFAMTINKSQGQSLSHVGIDARYSCFGHGQLYVALSRATDASNVRVLLPTGDTSTPNIVTPGGIPSSAVVNAHSAL